MKVIGISGITGSGKTSLAAMLATIFTSEILHIDDYYYNESDLPIYNGEPTWELPSSIDLGLLKEHLTLLKAGQDIDSPVYEHGKKAGWRSVSSEVDWLLVEGFLVLYSSAIRKLLDYTIFLDVDYLKALQRRNNKGKHVISPAYYFQHVLPIQQQYVEAYKYRADLIVSTDKFEKLSIARAVRQLLLA